MDLANDLRALIMEHLSSDLIKAEKYTVLRNKLINILQLLDENYCLANQMYQQLPISKFDNFAAYVYNTDANSINKIQGTSEKVKTIRTKRNNHSCPQCGRQLTVSGSESRCQSCGYMSDIKDHSNVKPGANNAKHINKQLDIITGVRKAPANIKKIIDYIIIWLTDLRYIYAWLVSRGRDRYNKFVEKLQEYLNIQIVDQWFNRVIERKPENMWKYNVFKLFTDEFYNMLEYTIRLASEGESNMCELPDDLAYFIVESWVKTYHTVPKIHDIISIPNDLLYQVINNIQPDRYASSLQSLNNTIKPIDHVIQRTNEIVNINDTSNVAVTNNPNLISQAYTPGQSNILSQHAKVYIDKNNTHTSYEIGLFINSLSFWVKIPDNNIKQRVERLFRRPISIPGLMFNFREVYRKADSIPKKYSYQQEFCWITNQTFHTPFIEIDTQDKQVIADIIHKFNTFYKDKMLKETGKSCNSPLYCCTLECILNLPFFEKYKPILDYVPMKDKDTAAHIHAEFHNFARTYSQLLKPYNVARGDEANKVNTVNFEEVNKPKPRRIRRKTKTTTPKVEIVEEVSQALPQIVLEDIQVQAPSIDLGFNFMDNMDNEPPIKHEEEEEQTYQPEEQYETYEAYDESDDSDDNILF